MDYLLENMSSSVRLCYMLVWKAFVGIYPKGTDIYIFNKYLHSNVHCNIIHNSWDMETTQMSLMDKWIRKRIKTIPHIYSEILFSYEKEWGIDTCYSVDEPGEHYA